MPRKFVITAVLNLVALASATPSVALELENGVNRGEANWQPLTAPIRKQYNIYPVAVYLDESRDRLYALSESVSWFHVSNGYQLIAGRAFSPFHDPDLEPEIINLYQEFDITPQARTFDNLVPSLGCFPRYPLRYGDVTGDGNMELVIFAQDEFYALNLTLFSTVLNKTIFSIRLSTYDAVLNTRKELPEGEEESASYPLADDPKDGQYLSRIVEQRTRMVSGIRPAIINFSKLYIDSFSAEDAHDLLVWRKLYRSRLNEDPIKRFELERDTFHHYQLVEGDYIQQDTDEATIKGWLAENELTWQKVYPNKRECEGEEGELIPEMHDPLLNDPDVLQ